jgi:hypothetical protein
VNQRHAKASATLSMALAGDALQVADQQDAQQEFRINRRTTGSGVAVVQPLSYTFKADVPVDPPQQVFRELIFLPGVVDNAFDVPVAPS